MGARVALGLGVLLTSACIDYLEPGELGVPRYFGDVLGEAPLRMHAPMSDRDGNAYVLFGTSTLDEIEVFVGHAAGGWTSGCDDPEDPPPTEGNRRLHGWVGRVQDRAWYWAGDELVEVKGTDGKCKSVLDNDPSSNANLAFKAVIPWVWDRPSRRTLLALVQGTTDARPWHVVIDLALDKDDDAATKEPAGIYSGLRSFSPSDATDVKVLGAGGNAEARTGVILVKYLRDSVTKAEALWLDENGDTTARVSVPEVTAVGEDGVVGYIAVQSNGLAAALLASGELLVFDDDDKAVKTDLGMTPVGVHLWEDRLWLVGTDGDKPLVAAIEGASGKLGPTTWDASRALARNLRGTIEVLNDRNAPRRYVDWDDPRTAIGEFPFLSTASLDHYALGTTGWLIAGLSYEYAGGEYRTRVAFVPAGVSYP